MEAKTTEWRPGPTVCRCCLTEGCYKDISTEYFWMGKREVYSEMLSETFDLNIAYSQSGGPNSNSRLICEPCISRLRDATDFKRQVLECERSFMQYLDPVGSGDIGVNLELDKEVKIERVKDEKTLLDDDDDFVPPEFGDGDEDEDDLDDQPLTKLASKIPKKESVDVLDLLDNAKITEKRKSSSKSKSSPAKKTKLKKEVASCSKVKPEPRKKKDAIRPLSQARRNAEVMVQYSTAYPFRLPETSLMCVYCFTDAASSMQMAKRNAQLVLQYSTAYPFRTRGNLMLCVYCCEEYADPKEYRIHMDRMHKSFTISTAFAHIGRSKEYLKVDLSDLKCRLCLTPCNNLNEIASHIRNIHGIVKLDTNFEIGMHPYRIDSDRWVCFVCDKKMASLTKLCRHTTCHYQKYTCDVCGRSYLTYEALKYHIRCNHSGKYVCRKCWKDFPTIEKKRDHVKNSKACWASICLSCGERFMSWESKQRHLVDVHGIPKKMFACPDCEETFDSRKLFYNHFKLNHSDDDTFVCSCCGLKYATKSQMEEHRASHTGEKPYQCNICVKTFSRSKGLKQHMWIHSEHKRFVCVICNKQFSQKVSLKGHVISHHPEVTEF